MNVNGISFGAVQWATQDQEEQFDSIHHNNRYPDNQYPVESAIFPAIYKDVLISGEGTVIVTGDNIAEMEDMAEQAANEARRAYVLSHLSTED